MDFACFEAAPVGLPRFYRGAPSVYFIKPAGATPNTERCSCRFFVPRPVCRLRLSIITLFFTSTGFIPLKFLLDNWILVLAALTSGGLLLWPLLTQGSQGGVVTTAEAVRLLNREKAILIDVCEPAEYAAGHVAGARNIPLAALDGHKSLPSNKALPLVLLCQSGSRSTRAAGMLRKAGYANVQTLSGGLAAWREANLPVEKSA
jgi:rhodanese-related sulfurtransferase